MAWALFVVFLAVCGTLIAAASFLLGLMIGTANAAAEAARLTEYLGPGRRIAPITRLRLLEVIISYIAVFGLAFFIAVRL